MLSVAGEPSKPYVGVPKIGGKPPKWMVYNRKPYWNGWFGGTPIFGNTQYRKTFSCHLEKMLSSRSQQCLQRLIQSWKNPTKWWAKITLMRRTYFTSHCALQGAGIKMKVSRCSRKLMIDDHPYYWTPYRKTVGQKKKGFELPVPKHQPNLARIIALFAWPQQIWAK